MNAIQTDQWKDFACMSEALILAASLHNLSLTPDEYRTKYEGLFPFPQKNYGGLVLSRFFIIASKIGLGQDMDLIWHYKDIKERRDKGLLVFVFSGLHLDPKRSDFFSHTSVLLAIDDKKFSVSGFSDLDADDWIKKRCCGIVFF